MNVWSTDVVALACILGSAAVGGGVTVAALDRPDREASVCVTRHGEGDPTVVMSLGGHAQTIVVRPRVSVHAAQACAPVVVDVDEVVTLRLDEVRAELDRARAQVEGARIQAEAAFSQELEARLRRDMERLERELAELDGVVVR